MPVLRHKWVFLYVLLVLKKVEMSPVDLHQLIGYSTVLYCSFVSQYYTQIYNSRANS